MLRPEDDFELFLHLLGYISSALATWVGLIVGGIITGGGGDGDRVRGCDVDL